MVALEGLEKKTKNSLPKYGAAREGQGILN